MIFTIRLRLVFCLAIVLLLSFTSLGVSRSVASEGGKQDSKECLSSQAKMQGINALPYIQHFWDFENIVSVPELESGDQVTQALLDQLHRDFERVTFQDLDAQSNEQVLGAGSSSHWLRLCVSNNSLLNQRMVVAVSPAITAEVDYYPVKLGAQAFKTGNALPMTTRDRYSAVFHFGLALEAGETQQIYMRVKARTKAYLVASIWSEAEYFVEKDKSETLDGIFIGIFLGLILYTILLYFSVRQSASLLYIIWCLSILLLLASIDGRVLQYVFPMQPTIAYLVTVIFYPVSVIVSALFARNFIGLSRYARHDQFGLILLGVFVLALMTSYGLGYALYFKMCAIFALFVCVYFGIVCPLYTGFRHRESRGRFLLFAQAALVLCAIDRVLFAVGVTSEYYLPYTPKVGLVTGMVLLAYYMGLVSYSERNAAQKHALEQKLKTAQLKSLNDEKSSFFSNVSHELRTPLTLILGPLTQLLDQDDGRNKIALEGVITQSLSLQKLVDELLLLSKFDDHSASLRASRVSINSTVSDICSKFNVLAQSNDIDFSVTQSVTDFDAYLDLEKFQIILNNLLSNAFKFTPSQGVINVSINVCNDDQIGEQESDDLSSDKYFDVVVSDSGYGVEEHERELIFTRYFQSSTSVYAGSGVGTGIGLALAKELVELHAGQIQALPRDSLEYAAGSSFVVRLPLGSAHLRAGELVGATTERSEVTPNPIASEPFEPLDAKGTNEGSETIMVVDDNSDMRDYIQDLLSTSYNVVLANDGLDAESKISMASPDLIITDLMMPNKDGIELIKSLKKDHSFIKIPVIILSAKADIDTRLNGLLAPADDYLTKPFDSRELLIRVRNLLKKQKQFSAFYSSDKGDKRSAIGHLNSNTNAGKQANFIDRARDIVDQNMQDPAFGVNELASHLHISRATLRRKLLDDSEYTPSEFIRHCRLEKARRLVELGSISSIKQLASSVGFSQGSYFSRLYEKTFNTPLEI